MVCVRAASDMCLQYDGLEHGNELEEMKGWLQYLYALRALVHMISLITISEHDS